MFLRLLRHLLPTGRAWRLVVDRMLKRYLGGLMAGAAEPARQAIDDVADDMRPDTTRALAQWGDEFGLVQPTTEEAQRAQLAAAWRAQGGQDPSYLQGILHDAGFTELFVHEWWEPNTEPRVVRDPRNYSGQPFIGTWQCGDPEALCGNAQVLCDRFLAGNPSYLVNRNLNPEAPPPLPSDPDLWRHFIYICGETFGDIVVVPADERAELERLLLKHCPMHAWIVIISDATLYLTDIDGAYLTDVDDAYLVLA